LNAAVADRASFTRLLVAGAAVVVILAGMRAAAEIVNTAVMALFFGIVLMPLYRWLVQRTGKTSRALGAMFVLVVLFGVVMGVFMLYSAGQMVAGVDSYSSAFDRNMDRAVTSLGESGQRLLEPVVAQLDGELIAGWLAGVAAALVNGVVNAVVALFIMMFFLSEAPALMGRFRAQLGADHPVVGRVRSYGESMITYFAVRTKLNLVTGVGITLILWLLGVDYAILWGVLAFFLSYIPYIGLILATIPGVVLAFAEYGLERALLVVAGILVWNLVIENVFQPAMTGKELSLSPTFVFIMFLLWSFILGPVGSFLAMPITVAAVLAMDTFDDSRWLAGLFGMPAREPAGASVGDVE
jgi:AI-2 transport protein TqsA